MTTTFITPSGRSGTEGRKARHSGSRIKVHNQVKTAACNQSACKTCERTLHKGKKGEWTTNERKCRYQNRFLWLDDSVRTLSMRRLDGHHVERGDQRPGRDLLLSLLLWFEENTPLMKSDVWRGEALSQEKEPCLTSSHRKQLNMAPRPQRRSRHWSPLIDLFKELLTSAGS